jgi:septum formation protein
VTHNGPPGDWTSHPSPGGLPFGESEAGGEPVKPNERDARIVLASASPRRRQLLAGFGLPFEVAVADVDEAPHAGEAPRALALRLAEEKARHVAARGVGGLVVAADTVVSLGRTLYGKPDGPADASRMLAALAGRAHRVTTGVAMARGDRVWSGSLASRVWLKPWLPEEIDAYVRSGDPLDKAGAYAIQNEQFRPVARLVGCRCNVVGFPLGLVARLLGEAGLPVSAERACPYRAFAPARCLS